MIITKPETFARNWGEEILIARTPTYAGKILKRDTGTRGGFQCHVKDESHYLLSGRLLVRVKQGAAVIGHTLEAGTAWHVPAMTVHQEEALADCVILEVGDPTSDDRYGIIPDPGGLPSMTNHEAMAKLQNLADAYRRKAVDCEHLLTAIQQLGLKGLAEQAR